MYVVTNRQLFTEKSGLDVFGDTPNPAGPNELRLLHVEPRGRGWNVEVLADKLDDATKRRLKLDPQQTHYASQLVAHEVVQCARKRKRHVLFFVHGFNNDVESVITRAQALERRYPVEVIAFTWPANGGGARGALSYKSDKRDARASAGALERTISKMQYYLQALTETERNKCWAAASKKYPADMELRDAWYARLLEKECPYTVNMMAHSMGNYVLKQALKSSLSEAPRILFDNIVLVAADTNNHDHALWVDRLQCRGRIFVAINEKDNALAASRMKSGDEQLARLGHVLYGLDARSATYVNFTDASYVRSSHAYFEGMAVDRNAAIKTFFHAAFTGGSAENALRYDAARNAYEFR